MKLQQHVTSPESCVYPAISRFHRWRSYCGARENQLGDFKLLNRRRLCLNAVVPARLWRSRSNTSGTKSSLQGPGTIPRPRGPLDCGNSGSTLRMLAGVLAGHDLTAELTGDASLSSRPMRRITPRPPPPHPGITPQKSPSLPPPSPPPPSPPLSEYMFRSVQLTAESECLV
jgi:hypothetical protein